MSMRQKNRSVWLWITIAIFLAMCLFLFYPLIKLFISAFQETGTGEFTFENFLKFCSKPYYYRSLFNSIKVTVVVTLLCCIIGIPMAYIMSNYEIKGKRVIEILIIVSLLSPPFIGAYSWIVLLGRNGIISNFLKSITGSGIEFSIYGFGGIVLVFTMKLYAYIYMYASGGLSKIDVSLTEAAENLGCHPLKKVFNMIVPLILPSVMAGALVVFANTFTDFGTPMMIGEGYRTMPVLVFQEFVGEVGGSANYAAALSMIMLVITIAIFLVQRYITNKKSFEMSSLRPIVPVKPKKLSGFFMHLFIYLFVLISLLPQITVIVSSFKNMSGPVYKEGWGFQNYIDAFETRGYTIANTYKFAILAVLIIMILGMVIAYVSVRQRSVFSSILDVVTMFPLVISGTVLGITLLLAFNSRPLRLTGTVAILVISLVIRRLPYTIRSSSAVLKQLSPSVEEASISLGCSPLKTFAKITGPLMLSGVFSGLILSWVTLITELSSSVILYTAKTQTMSVAIYLQVTRNEFGMAAALATLLTVTIILSLVIFFKATGKKSISL
ncbi:MAG TPA: iron ABC transporter permease [Candidatus Pullichristensenella excrementigallinarum]|uniref:Iron ABC transporter permease n=1 Tax=Candidatus Pullichristensenella excrementigallinarum TaxID=2840907 RepID=A0A9D1I9I3_9FIRM|nr:iron ABC transporter permease [Candidatus Pullichristensenella excrementigallinarum]